MPAGNPNPAPLLEVVLYQPEIAPNTGNIMRLCANTGCRLHLVRPYGFSLHGRQLRRAGLDYRDLVAVLQHADWRACCDYLGERRMVALTTRGGIRLDEAGFCAQDVLVFGSETGGLPDTVLAQFAPAATVRIPMLPESRSINLSNAVAIVVYEAWRQLNFARGK